MSGLTAGLPLRLSMMGIEGPKTSASRIPTALFNAERLRARLTAVVDLPTPPVRSN